MQPAMGDWLIRKQSPESTNSDFSRVPNLKKRDERTPFPVLAPKPGPRPTLRPAP